MPQAFEFKNLIKTYPDFKLGPLALDLAPGMVLGFVGPNGSGKSTTMHCLAGLVRPDSGSMEIFGRENDLNNRRGNSTSATSATFMCFMKRGRVKKICNFSRNFIRAGRMSSPPN